MKKNARNWYKIFVGSLVIVTISFVLIYKCYPNVCSNEVHNAITIIFFGSNLALTVAYLITAHKVGRRWLVWWFLSYITLGLATFYALILFNNDIKDASKKKTTFAA